MIAHFKLTPAVSATHMKWCPYRGTAQLTICFLVTSFLVGCYRQTDDGETDGQTQSSAFPSGGPESVGLTQFDSSRDGKPTAGVKQQFDLKRLAALMTAGQLETARNYLRPQLIDQPDNFELLFWAVRIEDALGQTNAAIELLSEIPEHDPNYGLIAIGQAADLLVKLGRFDEAIDRYERIAATEPNIAIARRQLASLYNRLGRRQLAVEHLRSLLRIGDITQQELAALLCQRDAAFTDFHSLSKVNPPDDESGWIGPIARARLLVTEDRLPEAYRLLKEVFVEATEAPSVATAKRHDPSSIALLGRVVAELQNPEGIALWCSLVDDRQEHFAEYWFALGFLSLSLGDNAQPTMTAAMLGQCVLLDPTEWVAYGLLQNVMNRLGEADKEQAFHDRATLIKRSIIASNEISEKGLQSTNAIIRLTESLRQLHRPLEVNAWQLIAASSLVPSGEDPGRTSEFQKTHQNLVASNRGFPSQDEILCSLKLPPDVFRIRDDLLMRIRKKYPFHDFRTSRAIALSSVPQFASIGSWKMRETDVDLNFQYRNNDPIRNRDFQLYEQFGGGVAAFDYDRDGKVDFYFAQSAGPPLANRGTHPNQLFAQRRGQFIDVTNESNVGDRGYGLGIAVGDINQDGFDDLLVANFGRNAIYLNQGDGTFIKSVQKKLCDAENWTSSVAVADLNGDGLPDIFEANYIDDESVMDRSAEGADGRLAHFPGPEDFRSAEDRLLIQTDDAQWVEGHLNGVSLPAPGLGILIGNLDLSNTTNEIFVANDTRPNQLWQYREQSWWDTAKLKGCAYSARGGSGASMGIAAADFDNNGQLDLHVTNFYNEPVHLYMQENEGAFIDKVVPSGLYGDSMPVLGFGTVASDFDNDGDADIVTVNGHIDDLRFRNAPFRMKPQLFMNENGRFTLRRDASQRGSDSFFNRESVGRGLIKTDWNRDGRLDLVSTHLDQPANLVENMTELTSHWIQFECVGTVSERSAVGTIVNVKTNAGSSKHWLMSGGGYSCHDERIVHVGLGQADRIETVDVLWPSGMNQRFELNCIDCRVLLIEGEEKAHVLSS